MKKKVCYSFFTALLCGVFFCTACSDDSDLNGILGIKSEAIVYYGYSVNSASQIDFKFSKEVSVLDAKFTPDLEISEALPGETVSLCLSEERCTGEKFVADILVGDSSGNTLSLLVPFRTLNDRVPEMVINEVRTEFSKPRTEFIEFKTKTAGNLGAVRLFVISVNAEEEVYEFPPAEVTAGEYIVLHLRTLPDDIAIDETEDDLTLSSMGNKKEAADSKFARDFWIPDSKKRIHKTDVIYIMDQKDNILDAVVLCENEKAWEKNKVFAKACEKLAEQKQWFSKDALLIKKLSSEDAVASTAIKTSATKSISRIETDDFVQDTNTLQDWYIAATASGAGQASPGRRND